MDELTRKIWGFIENPRKGYFFRQDKPKYNQFCSSLDALRDTDAAITTYRSLKFDFDENIGLGYLLIYGLLQSLFVQQDALFHLCETLGIQEKLDHYPRLREIREIRNDSIGHPTKKRGYKSKTVSSHQISQISMNSGGFELLSFYSDGRIEHREVIVVDLIADQEEYVKQVLSSVIEALKSEEQKHKEKFRMDKLAAIFPPNLDYYVGKVSDGIHSFEFAPHTSVGASQASLSYLLGLMENLLNALKERGIELDTYDSLKYLYEELEYPIVELKQFFSALSDGNEPKLNPKAANIFAFFLCHKFPELKREAEKIDKEYES